MRSYFVAGASLKASRTRTRHIASLGDPPGRANQLSNWSRVIVWLATGARYSIVSFVHGGLVGSRLTVSSSGSMAGILRKRAIAIPAASKVDSASTSHACSIPLGSINETRHFIRTTGVYHRGFRLLFAIDSRLAGVCQ